MVLFILAAIWAAVLLPPWLQGRRSTRPQSSVIDFRQQLAVLDRAIDPSHYHGRPQPARTGGMDRRELQRRRRDVLTTLVASAGLTLVLALAFGGVAWLLQLTVDALLLGYVAMLLQVQQRRLDTQATVRYLPQRQAQTQPQAQQLLLRRAR